MLIEREPELAALGDVLERGRAGAGSLAVIRGGLGVGRSALLHACGALAVDQGMRVLRATCAPTEQRFGYGVVRQLLDPVLSRERNLPEDVWADPQPAPEPGPVARHATLQRLLALVGDEAAETPLVLLVDDLQWADPQSLRWVAFLANRLRAMPLVVVVSVLDGDTGTEGLVVNDLVRCAAQAVCPRPLSVDGVRAFLEARCAEPADEEFAAACHAHTAGNPMFLAALAAGLLADDIRPVAERCTRVRTLRVAGPSSRLARCLRSQPRRVEQFARAVAVLGDAATPAFVAELAGLDPADFDEAERALRRLGLLAADGALRFVDVVVPDALAGAQTANEHDDIHLRAAGLLYRGGGELEHVARHVLASSAEPEPWATEVLRAAAGSASGRGERELAVRYLRHALLHGDAGRGTLLADLAAVERGHDPVAASRHLQQALPLLDSAADRAAALCLAPVMGGMRGAPSAESTRRVLDELTAAAPPDEEGTEHLRRLEARLWFLEQDDPAALAAAARRLEALGPCPSVDGPGQRELVTVLSHAAMLNELVSREKVAELAHRVLEREPGHRAHMYSTLPLVVPMLVAADSPDGLESWLTAAAAGAGEPDLATVLAWSHQARLSAAGGYLGRATEHALAALNGAAAGLPGVESECAMLLASIAVETRDPELALLARRAQVVEHPPWASSMTLGAVALTTGDFPSAMEYFTDFGRQLHRAGRTNLALYPWRLLVALSQHRMGHRERAAELVEAEYEHALRWGAPSCVGRALRLRAALAGVGDGRARRLLHESVAVLAGSANRLELAKSLVALGKRARLAGDAEAEAYLRRGGRLGALCGVPRLAERAAGPVVPPPGSTAGAGAALTTTERRVVGLAVAGDRNKDIAGKLGVSTRAVEKHLTSSYRKLGIDGRAELATAVRGIGIGGLVEGPRAG